jgi:hypothetical protein
MALRESYLTARPKRLRFLIFNTAGRIVHHARRVLCRIAGAGWRDWMRLMPHGFFTLPVSTVPPSPIFPISTVLKLLLPKDNP